MLGKKVDSHTAFPSLYPEFSNKHQTDLSMEVTKPVKLGSRSLVVVVKLVLGLHVGQGGQTQPLTSYTWHRVGWHHGGFRK